MIRIEIPKDKLLEGLEKAVPGWLAKKTKSWRDVNPYYLALQSSLCAYCEGARDFIRTEATDSESIPKENDGEFAVEHFRPKGKTAVWPDVFSRKWLVAQGVATRLIHGGRTKGYGGLRFAPWNYVASCYTCNSTLKGNRFPIAGTPAKSVSGAGRDDIEALNQAERPLLIFPLGDLDDDPESLFEWEGVMIRPRSGMESHKTLRAQTTITFFRLDGNGRPHLVQERFRQLTSLIGVLKLGIDVRLALDTWPFRGCLRAFHKLYQSKPEVAERLVRDSNSELEKIGREIKARAEAARKGKLHPSRGSRRRNG